MVARATATVTWDNEEFSLSESPTNYIPGRRRAPPGEPHRLIEVQSGSNLSEDDIARLNDHYGRVETQFSR